MRIRSHIAENQVLLGSDLLPNLAVVNGETPASVRERSEPPASHRVHASFRLQLRLGVSSPERPDKMTMHCTNNSMNFHSRIRLATLLAMLLSLSARAADWPQWRGPNRDNVWNETGILRTFPYKGLKFRWRTPVGPGWTSPVVVQGGVYLTDMRLDKPKAWERIRCFKESTGKLLWSREYELVYPEFCFNPEQGGGPAATLIVEAGKVYWQGRSGQVECLDARSGKVIWEIHLGTKYTIGILSVRGSPLIEGNLLILVAG